VVPLPLTATFFQIMLRGASDPVAALPRPGDGVAGEFVGACAAMLADATSGPTGRLSEIAADPEWSRKYMQPVDEEPVPLAPFAAYAADAAFVETGLSGAPLCPNGANRPITTDNVEEFVKLAATFWLETGVKHQMIAFRRGLYDVLGGGAVMLWAFSAAELRRLFCGEDEVMWTEKELAEHLYCGGGFSPESEQVRWLREEMLAMEPPLRALPGICHFLSTIASGRTEGASIECSSRSSRGGRFSKIPCMCSSTFLAEICEPGRTRKTTA